MEFDKLQNNRKVIQNIAKHNWEVLPEEYYKINIVGAFDPKTRTGGWGFVVRNTKGEILRADATNISIWHPLYKPMQLQLLGVCNMLYSLPAWHETYHSREGYIVLASARKEIGIDESPIGGLVLQIREHAIEIFFMSYLGL